MFKCGVKAPLPKNTTPLLSDAQCKYVQEIVRILLYYSCAMDSTLACALSSIAVRQIHGTTSVLDACHQLLDYIAMHPHAAICYHASKMILALYFDASYLSEPDSKSCMGGATSSLFMMAMHQTMVLSSPWQQSSNMLYPQHLKLNLLLSFTIVKMQCPCLKHSRKWDTTSPKLLPPLIILLPIALSLTQ